MKFCVPNEVSRPHIMNGISLTYMAGAGGSKKVGS